MHVLRLKIGISDRYTESDATRYPNPKDPTRPVLMAGLGLWFPWFRSFMNLHLGARDE